MVSDGAGHGVRMEVLGTPAAPIVRVTGELDLASAEAARAVLDGSLGSDVQRVGLDLADLEFLDSSGLAVLLELAARVPVTIDAASPSVRRIIEVTGLDDVLGLPE